MEKICTAKLPSGLEVMQNFVYHHIVKHLSKHLAASSVYEEILPFWQKAHIPTTKKCNAILKISRLYQQMRDLQKNRKRNNAVEMRKQAECTAKLKHLFDIAHANAETLIKIDEDRQFLQQQRADRGVSFGPADVSLAQRQRRSASRAGNRQRQQTAATASTSVAATASTSAAATASTSAAATASISAAGHHRPRRPARASTTQQRTALPATAPTKRRKPQLSMSVAAVLDRTNISVRKSAMIVASVLNIAGSSPNVLSRSTVHRHRQKRRRQLAGMIRSSYQVTKSVVHWDGKLLPDVAGPASSTSLVERLSILVTSTADGITKLLGVPKLPAGTGEAAASAVIEHLFQWDAVPAVVGMCFDTTAVNTGPHSGACVKLNLLWLACRHHMLEVLLSDIFTVCLGVSTGPEILLFKNFRAIWPDLAHVPQATERPLITAPDDDMQFIKQQLDVVQTREDYLELLRLAARCVGVEVDAAIRRPGAIHRARWMAKAIYCLKMLITYSGNEHLLKLTGRQLRGLQRFGRFVCLVYIQSWYTCRSAADAAFNDIALQQRIREYDDVDISRIGQKMLKRHSWYVSPELATMILFSDKIDNSMKTTGGNDSGRTWAAPGQR